MNEQMKPCPFCGSDAKKSTCDRLILIGCVSCMYERSFPGLLQKTPSDKPILQYRDGDCIKQIAPEDAKEFYHHDANEKAIKEWNTRITVREA